MRQFLHSTLSFTKFTFAARKCKRKKAFVRFRNEIWCMDLVHVIKLAKDCNVVQNLLVRQDLFDRTLDAYRKKTKGSTETARAFSTVNTNKIQNMKV